MNKSVALALSALLFAPVTAGAQDWPTKTVRIIGPFGPGSNPGMVGRLIGDRSLSHLAMEALALKSGTTMVHVPYAGSPQAMTALLRNDVQMACLPAISAVPHVASGQIKILAVSLGRRSALLPGVPTLKEAGLGLEAGAWDRLVGPANTP